MTSLVFKLLIAVSLLAHTVLGCCWHHAHAGECPEAAAATSECPRDCAAERAAEHPPQGDTVAEPAGAACGLCDEPAEPLATCDEPDCSYIKSRTMPEPALGAPIAAATGDFCTVPAVHGGRLNFAGVAPRARGATAALRAALQLWLI